MTTAERIVAMDRQLSAIRHVVIWLPTTESALACNRVWERLYAVADKFEFPNGTRGE